VRYGEHIVPGGYSLPHAYRDDTIGGLYGLLGLLRHFHRFCEFPLSLQDLREQVPHRPEQIDVRAIHAVGIHQAQVDLVNQCCIACRVELGGSERILRMAS